MRSLVGVLRWVVALAMPVFIVLLWLWILWRPWFVRLEYGKPNFPPDRYGFTTAERLSFSLAWIDYYHSDKSPEDGIRSLEALKLPGTNLPLHDPSEVSHMIDVRRLTDKFWRVVLPVSALLVIGGLAALLSNRRTRRDGIASLFMGGLITTAVLLCFIIFVLLSWQTLFVTFHNVFFPPGTWTFDYSSTLIRLFPEQLWFDGGLMLVGGALAAGIVVMLVGHLLGRVSPAVKPTLQSNPLD